MNKSNDESIDIEALEALWAASWREEQIRLGFTIDEL
jgi:hypothetical protein